MARGLLGSSKIVWKCYFANMNGRTKRHHIVPQFMQRSFCNTEGKLWYSDHNSKGQYNAPELRTPKGCFWQRDYYTVLEGGAASDVVERKVYGNLDDFLGRLFPEVLAILENGNIPKMDAKLEDVLKLAVFRMLTRTPDFVAHNDREIGRNYLDGLTEGYQEMGGYEVELEKAKSELLDDAKLQSYGRDIRTRGTLYDAPRSNEELKKRSFRWAKAPQKHSYVLSSRIALRIGNGGSNGLRNPDSEIWVPLSPKFCMILLIDNYGKIPHLNEDSREHVRKLNEYAKESSYAIASHSEKLIRSLLRT